MIRLYIADTDAGFIAMVRRALKNSKRIEIAGAADNGRRALRDVVALKPDVLLTDMQLPEMDGLALLRETRRLNRIPSVIICTRFYTGASVELALKHGASYFLCKPIAFEHLPEMIVECAMSGTNRASSVSAEAQAAPGPREAEILALLNGLGVSPRLNGGLYLLEAVRCLRDNRLLLRNLSQGLYAELAQRLNTTEARVERCLRSAIAIGYERGSMAQVFPRRPTNREFIEYLMAALD